jgi:hypothetical protein
MEDAKPDGGRTAGSDRPIGAIDARSCGATAATSDRLQRGAAPAAPAMTKRRINEAARKAMADAVRRWWRR